MRSDDIPLGRLWRVSAGTSIIGQCEDCCECPAAVVVYPGRPTVTTYCSSKEGTAQISGHYGFNGDPLDDTWEGFARIWQKERGTADSRNWTSGWIYYDSATECTGTQTGTASGICYLYKNSDASGAGWITRDYTSDGCGTNSSTEDSELYQCAFEIPTLLLDSGTAEGLCDSIGLFTSGTGYASLPELVGDMIGTGLSGNYYNSADSFCTSTHTTSLTSDVMILNGREVYCEPGYKYYLDTGGDMRIAVELSEEASIFDYVCDPITGSQCTATTDSLSTSGGGLTFEGRTVAVTANIVGDPETEYNFRAHFTNSVGPDSYEDFTTTTDTSGNAVITFDIPTPSVGESRTFVGLEYRGYDYVVKFPEPLLPPGCLRASWSDDQGSHCEEWDGVLPEGYNRYDEDTWPEFGPFTVEDPFAEITTPVVLCDCTSCP